MATIDVGDSTKREVNFELPLIPFIDFLLCLVSFLLITAVWSQLSRLEASARVPGSPELTHSTPEQPRRLHVRVEDERFHLAWRQGSTLIATKTVERRPVPAGNDVTYPELARQVTAEWQANGLHRDSSDRRHDQAVLHASNTTSFAELVAVMDAINAPQRELAVGGTRQSVPAFSVSFAVD